MINIPDRLKELSFVLCNENKQPIQKGWQKKIIKADDPELVAHLQAGNNYGVICGDKSFIEKDGKTYFLIVVDFDIKEYQDKIKPLLPETFTTTSGSSKNCVHLWFASDNDKSFKIHTRKLDTICDVQGTGKQIIAPGSKHNSGSTYTIINDIDFAFIPYSELQAILMPFDEKPKKASKIKKTNAIKQYNQDLIKVMMDIVSMKDVLDEIGIDSSKNPTNCFAHNSKGGKCFSYTDELCNCFHCSGSWNKYSLLKEAKRFTDKQVYEWFAEKSGMKDELEKSRKDYIEKKKEEENKLRKQKAEEDRKKSIDEIKSIIDRGLNPTSVQQNVDMLYKLNPFCYTKGDFFYFWSENESRWIDADNTDVMVLIDTKLGITGYTNDSKITTQYMNAFKRTGRRYMPKEVPTEFVQFGNTVYNIKTQEQIKASSEYFLINTIPHEVSDDDSTPEIDKFLEEWVGSEYVLTAKQIIAYCCLNDYPINRIFVFTGGGSNGKSTFLDLIEKFIGSRNICSTSLDQLTENRFEAYNLFGKKVALIGETNFGLLQKTELIKRLSGRDTITFEAKNKGAFFGKNTAKLIISSNSLPTSDDTSDGFYRRFLILDFPNQYKEVSNILDRIPEAEFSNLARWCVNNLHKLLKSGGFHREGDIQERKMKYIMASNPLPIFLENHCDIDHENTAWWIPHSKLYTEYAKHLVSQKRRVIKRNEFSKAMTEMGFELTKTTKNTGLNEFYSGYLYTGIRFRISVDKTYTKKNDVNDVNDVVSTQILTYRDQGKTTSFTSFTSLVTLVGRKLEEKTELTTEQIDFILGDGGTQKLSEEGYIFQVRPDVWRKI